MLKVLIRNAKYLTWAQIGVTFLLAGLAGIKVVDAQTAETWAIILLGGSTATATVSQAPQFAADIHKTN